MATDRVIAGGSNQQRKFRIARRDGATMMKACADSGLSMAEARLLDAEDRRNPPGPECFELLNTAPPEAAPHQGDDDMARPRRKDSVEEIHAPDYGLAVKIYREDIKPAQSSVGEHAQEMSTAYKEIKKRAHIQPGAAKLAFRLDNMEESKRDDYLRSFNGLLKELKIFMPADLVDAAEGKGKVAEAVVPTGQRARPKLATVPTGPADDSDLVEAAENLPHAAE